MSRPEASAAVSSVAERHVNRSNPRAPDVDQRAIAVGQFERGWARAASRTADCSRLILSVHGPGSPDRDRELLCHGGIHDPCGTVHVGHRERDSKPCGGADAAG